MITLKFEVEVDIEVGVEKGNYTENEIFEMASNIDLGIRREDQTFGITPKDRFDSEVRLIRVKPINQ
jgi:hypothetical protein